MGQYDVPAYIDYILKETGKPKLIYVGHSMGSTIFFIAMASHPQLNDKIELMIALAPVASMAHLRSPLKKLAPYVDIIRVLYNFRKYSLLVASCCNLRIGVE